MALAPAPAVAGVATMRCQTDVSIYSWEPLPRATIHRLVEGRVLQQLTRSGKLTLAPDGAAAAPDLTLEVTARIIEDAQQFSVLLSATPRRQNRAGSMGAVSTQSIRRMSHAQIQAQMERAADEAARRLEQLLVPWLPSITEDQPTAEVVPIDISGRPVIDWARELRLEGLSGGGVGAAGLEALGTRAVKEAGARLSLAHCAMTGTTADLRGRCIDALAQLARSHPSAQRALIAVLFEPPPERNSGPWEEARRRAFKITTGFTGAAKQEAVQAWLHILASDHSERYDLFGHRREDYSLLGPIAEYLERHTSVPNLDLALAHCSRPGRYKEAPPAGECLRVLQKVPVERRLALLYTQLAAPPSFSFYDEWKGWYAMLETVVDRGKPLHPAVEQVCLRRLQRSYAAADRRRCLEYLGKQGAPTPALLTALVAVFISADHEIYLGAEGALRELVKRKPALCPTLEKTLGPRAARGDYPNYYPRNDAPSPLKECRSGKL